jgi:large subunit ribosomal protein L31
LRFRICYIEKLEIQDKAPKMKDKFHPAYHLVSVTCACGNVFQSRSTIPGDTLKVEICSACHPFFTGQQKLVDTAGRVDKFLKKYKRTQA